MALQDETTTPEQTETTAQDTETVEENAPVETTTPGEGTPTQAPEDIPPEGDQVVPRDELWEMRELTFTTEFNWFVRQFGQGRDGEIYVLVSKRGIPEDDTGAVLQLVPPEEGETTQPGG